MKNMLAFGGEGFSPLSFTVDRAVNQTGNIFYRHFYWSTSLRQYEGVFKLFY